MSIGSVVKFELINKASSLRDASDREAASMLESFADQVDAVSKVARENNTVDLMMNTISDHFDLIAENYSVDTLRSVADFLDSMFTRLLNS